jgi:hypothetical protein
MAGLGVPPPALADRTATAVGPFTSDQSWTITGNTATETKQATTSLQFRSKRQWGVSPSLSLTDGQVLALSGELATSRVQTRTLDATGGNYLWFAWPADFGAPDFWVGGFQNTAWVETIRDVENASGYVRSYRLYRSTFLQNGSGIVVEVR